jgi:hypothetical protein
LRFAQNQPAVETKPVDFADFVGKTTARSRPVGTVGFDSDTRLELVRKRKMKAEPSLLSKLGHAPADSHDNWRYGIDCTSGILLETKVFHSHDPFRP